MTYGDGEAHRLSGGLLRGGVGFQAYALDARLRVAREPDVGLGLSQIALKTATKARSRGRKLSHGAPSDQLVPQFGRLRHAHSPAAGRCRCPRAH